MAEPLSILSELHKGKYEASVVATFNSYFPFYEDVLLRHFISAGCRYNVLLMDARQCGAALLSESTRPRLGGKAYTLIPVKASKAFHPKLVFLIGKANGLLYVGSHNATLAGFSHNREITNRFEFMGDKDTVSLAAIQSAWNFVKAWTSDLPESLLFALADIESFAKWLSIPISGDKEASFVGIMPTGPSLWKKVSQQLPHDIRRITVVGPFFDSGLAFLKELNAKFPSAELIVGIDPRTVSITKRAVNILPQAKFVDVDCLRDGIGYLHAKAILFETQDRREVLITGSANPSKPAWLDPPGTSNAEAVVLRVSSQKNSIARELGIRNLAKQPQLSAEDWDNVEVNKQQPDLSKETFLSPLIAIAKDGAFEIDTRFLNEALIPDATILNSKSEIIGTCTAEMTSERPLRFCVPDDRSFANASLLKLFSRDGKQVFAIVHHERELSEASFTGRQKELRTALASLESDTPMVEELIRIVEKVIFDDVSEVSLEQISHREKEGKESAAAEPVQSSFRVYLKDIRRQKYKKKSISPGDLGLLLDALIHRLGIGLQAEIHSSPGYKISEEDLRDSEEEYLIQTQEIDGRGLVRTCHRKMKNLFRRMIRQVENAAGSQERSLMAIAQMAAVLSLSQRLCELDWQTVHWIPKGETLVPEDARLKFFFDATRLLYSRKGKIIESALSAMHSNPCLEVSVVRGLLLSLAWDCGLSTRIEDGDSESVKVSLSGLSRLLLIGPDSLNDKEALERAADCISRLWSRYYNSPFETSWLDELVQWATEIKKACQNLRQAPVMQHRPDTGDLVFPTKSMNPELYVAIETSQNKVRVIDIDGEKEQKIYAEGYVAVVKHKL